MRAPVFFNNGLTHFLTKTQPLSLTLNASLSQTAEKINYPSSLSGFRPSHAIYTPPNDFFAARIVPSFFWTAPLPFFLPSSPSKRHAICKTLIECDLNVTDF